MTTKPATCDLFLINADDECEGDALMTVNFSGVVTLDIPIEGPEWLPQQYMKMVIRRGTSWNLCVECMCRFAIVSALDSNRQACEDYVTLEPCNITVVDQPCNPQGCSTCPMCHFGASFGGRNDNTYFATCKLIQNARIDRKEALLFELPISEGSMHPGHAIVESWIEATKDHEWFMKRGQVYTLGEVCPSPFDEKDNQLFYRSHALHWLLEGQTCVATWADFTTYLWQVIDTHKGLREKADNIWKDVEIAGEDVLETLRAANAAFPVHAAAGNILFEFCEAFEHHYGGDNGNSQLKEAAIRHDFGALVEHLKVSTGRNERPENYPPVPEDYQHVGDYMDAGDIVLSCMSWRACPESTEEQAKTWALEKAEAVMPTGKDMKWTLGDVFGCEEDGWNVDTILEEIYTYRLPDDDLPSIKDAFAHAAANGGSITLTLEMED